jgi:DNA-binding response OmpR family regulator
MAVDKNAGTYDNELVEEHSTGKTILIVEDEKLLSEMYEDVFEKEGFYVKVAATGKEAIAITKETKPDFVLLDILLPEENGIYYLQQKKKDPDIANISVMAFSNFDDPYIKKNALKLGAKDYLIKTNYTPQEVVDKVKIHLKYPVTSRGV